MKTLSLYIHIPWCVKKCPYCDFNSHAVKSELEDKQSQEQRYVDVLLQDLADDLKLLSCPTVIDSIFIGGGTPSLFTADSINLILSGINNLVTVDKNAEITLEANPGTFESQKFADFRQLGINRLSIGVQSFNQQHLTTLGRIHSAEEAKTAIEIAKQSGFDNLNLDLMFGLPEQTEQQMLLDVETAINFRPSHISFYQLTLEPNTYFHKFPPVLPEDDQIYQAQLKSQLLLADAGFQQYEISAYAQTSKNCRHNCNYWRFGDYLGIGAGAHGKISCSKTGTILRTSKNKNPELYMQNSTAITQVLSNADIPLEFLMNNLRLKQGFNLDHFQAVTGLNKASLEPGLTNCINDGLLQLTEKNYQCTKKGWDFIDHILQQFMPG